ncbi:hypothetical protein WKI71_18080 [Streptomyces sp. MS1.AVA.1]
MLIGIVLAALAALMRSERQFGIRTAWAVALVGLVFAVLSNSSTWAGPATLVYGIALLAAALLGADGARARVAEQSFGWRQPVAALVAFAAAAGPLLVAAGWMIRGADGPLERRDPVQVPAFVAEESGTRDQARTLVLDSESSAHVGYMLVRGSGARLGDAELAAADGENTKLDKIVANLVAGSGADQADQLGAFAVRYVLVHKGAPREVTRVLDATPGLSRLSEQNGSALWRIDRQVSRAAVVAAGSGAGEPQPVAAGPVEIHTTIPSGAEGRVLRLADSADDGWTATLDGKPLTATTVDGWAQGFELPAGGGKLDVTHDDPIGHSAWLWAQGFLALVLVVMALPGRRRDIDDDLPEEPVVPAEAMAGEGRRARRLRAQAEADAEEAGQQGEFPAPPSEPPAAAIPQQQSYGEWDTPGYSGAEYGNYGGQQYPAGGAYDQAYQADPYQGGQYDPYAYGGQSPTAAYDPSYDQTYQQGYDGTYDPAQQHPHGSERPDGSQQ